MSLKKLRPLTSKGSDLGANVFPTRCTEDNTEITRFGQSEYEFDVVAWLAARSGVDPVSIKHQISVWLIGENRS